MAILRLGIFPILTHQPPPNSRSSLFLFFYCCSSTIVSIFTPPLPRPTQPCFPPSNLHPLALSMCPLCMLLDRPSPIFPHCPSPIPSGYCQFVLYFNVSGLLFLKAGNRPLDPALWWVSGDGDEVRWNFSQLSELSQQVANVLSGACGLQRGDRVAVVLPRVPEWWLVTLGCMRAGW